MADMESKSNSVKLMLQVFAVIIGAVVLFKVGIFFLERLRDEAIAQRHEKSAMEKTEALGFEVYRAGTEFYSEDRSFKIPIEVNLYSMDSLLNDTLVFAGSSHPDEVARVGVVVMKIPRNEELSAVDNWQKFMSDRTQSEEEMPLVDGKVEERGNEVVFNIKTHFRKGLVRLVPKGDIMYVITVASTPSAWSLYEMPLTRTLEGFSLL